MMSNSLLFSDNNSLDGIAVNKIGLSWLTEPLLILLIPDIQAAWMKLLYGGILGYRRDAKKPGKNYQAYNEVSRLFARPILISGSKVCCRQHFGRVSESMDYAGVNRISGIFQDILNDTYDRQKTGRERHLFLLRLYAGRVYRFY
jgi:hypothetical protein